MAETEVRSKILETQIFCWLRLLCKNSSGFRTIWYQFSLRLFTLTQTLVLSNASKYFTRGQLYQIFFWKIIKTLKYLCRKPLLRKCFDLLLSLRQWLRNQMRKLLCETGTVVVWVGKTGPKFSLYMMFPGGPWIRQD